MMSNLLKRDDIEQKIMAIIADKMTVNKNLLSPNATWADLGLDSLDLVEIILETEDTFNCLIDDAKIEEMETVAQMIDYVHGLIR